MNSEKRIAKSEKFKVKVLAASLGVFMLSSFIHRAKAFTVAASQVFLNDPGFTANYLDIDKQWGLVKTGFTEVWDKVSGSENIVVAVIDTGIDETHEDLKSIHFVPGYDFVNRKEIVNNTNSDDNGHGTLITGVLGAAPNNQIGIVGTNWKISIMPVKALDLNGKGDSSAIAEAIVWAVDNGAQIINLSVGGISFGHDRILSDAVTYAFKKNAVLVAAAGNDSFFEGVNLDDSPVFPICEDNGFNMIIGVAAVDQNDLKPEFSNFGKNCIDVAAPGKRILTTINHDPITKTYTPNAYAYASGTSLAAPFVAGQAALIKSLYPNATNTQIRDRILASAEQIDFLNIYQCAGKPCKGLLGAGRINIKKSIEINIENLNILEGDLVRAQETGVVYFISGGKKQLISSFVYNQRFMGTPIKNLFLSQLSRFPDGTYAIPLNDTLVKIENNPTVYIIKNGLKLPIISKVFSQRKLMFSSINVVSPAELDSWITGSFYPPMEGSIVKNQSGKNLFWVIGETFRPINRQFILSRGIQKFPQIILANKDLPGFSKGEALAR